MKICIDPGHGGRDPGAQFKGLNEKDVTLHIAKEIQRTLLYSSVETVFTRLYDEYLPLRERTDIANASGADYFLSIHVNADPDDDSDEDIEAEGQEIWIYPGSERGLEFANHIGDGLRAEFPDEPWRGFKERGLYVLRKTTMPSALVEVGFIDHSETNRELKTAAVRRQLAFAIVRGIVGIKETT